MNDDVLVAAVSPDAKYLAAALLDSTVKVKFFLSFILYLSWLPDKAVFALLAGILW